MEGRDKALAPRKRPSQYERPSPAKTRTASAGVDKGFNPRVVRSICTRPPFETWPVGRQAGRGCQEGKSRRVPKGPLIPARMFVTASRATQRVGQVQGLRLRQPYRRCAVPRPSTSSREPLRRRRPLSHFARQFASPISSSAFVDVTNSARTGLGCALPSRSGRRPASGRSKNPGRLPAARRSFAPRPSRSVWPSPHWTCSITGRDMIGMPTKRIVPLVQRIPWRTLLATEPITIDASRESTWRSRS